VRTCAPRCQLCRRQRKSCHTHTPGIRRWPLHSCRPTSQEGGLACRRFGFLRTLRPSYCSRNCASGCQTRRIGKWRCWPARAVIAGSAYSSPPGRPGTFLTLFLNDLPPVLSFGDSWSYSDTAICNPAKPPSSTLDHVQSQSRQRSLLVAGLHIETCLIHRFDDLVEGDLVTF
jgi:hypothetical protein